MEAKPQIWTFSMGVRRPQYGECSKQCSSGPYTDSERPDYFKSWHTSSFNNCTFKFISISVPLMLLDELFQAIIY